MKIAFLINEYETLVPGQTTAMLIAAAIGRGHEVSVLGVADMGFSESLGVQGFVRVATGLSQGFSFADVVRALKSATASPMSLEGIDMLMIRTNPARDMGRRWAHDTALTLCRMLRERGVLVLNDPDGLRRASNKLYLCELPAHLRPHTIVSNEPAEIRRIVKEMTLPCVLKPLQGTRGKDVFFVEPGQHNNLNQIIDVLTRSGTAMIQEFLPEAVNGDIRVVVVEGEILAEGDKIAAIARVPGDGELRSNIHAGGEARPPVISDAIHAAVDAIRPQLVADGIFMAGLDFIGEKMVELNVFSTGGLRDAERFTGLSFTSMVLEKVEHRFQRHEETKR